MVGPAILAVLIIFAVAGSLAWRVYKQHKEFREKMLKDFHEQQQVIDKALKLAEGPFYSYSEEICERWCRDGNRIRKFAHT